LIFSKTLREEKEEFPPFIMTIRTKSALFDICMIFLKRFYPDLSFVKAAIPLAAAKAAAMVAIYGTLHLIAALRI
jgi:hypothetical protein